MYCKHCGKEVNEDAVVCLHCGRQLKIIQTTASLANPKNSESKVGIGILLALFLGIIGLVIGICLYSKNDFERDTFLKGWGTTFAIAFFSVLLLFVISSAFVA